MPKLFTRKGDNGTTQIGTCRVSKANPISELIGAIDTLHAEIGWLHEYVKCDQIKALCLVLIRTCMDLSSKINQGFDSFGDPALVKILEGWIAFWANSTPPLKEFVVMAGIGPAALKANDCRVLTRDIERKWVACGGDPDDPDSHFLNRLSSFFFALSRFLRSDTETVRSQLKSLPWPMAPV